MYFIYVYWRDEAIFIMNLFDKKNYFPGWQIVHTNAIHCSLYRQRYFLTIIKMKKKKKWENPLKYANANETLQYV